MEKNPPASTGDMGLIPGSAGSPEGGNGNSLQYSCLDNPVDRGAWLQSVGSQRVVHNLGTEYTHTHTHTQEPCTFQISFSYEVALGFVSSQG